MAADITIGDPEDPDPSGVERTVTFVTSRDQKVFKVPEDRLRRFVPKFVRFNFDENLVNLDERSFEVFMKMIDGEEIDLESTAVALDLARLAEKFHCIKLYHTCNVYLENNHRGRLALEVYEHARSGGLRTLEKDCREYVVKNFDSFLHGEEFNRVSVNTVAEFFASDDVEVAERDLARALVAYAKAKDSSRDSIRPAVEHIRFKAMDAKDFCSIQGIDSLLTPEEMYWILRDIVLCSPSEQASLTRDRRRTVRLRYKVRETPGRWKLSSHLTNAFLESVTVGEDFCGTIKSMAFVQNRSEVPLECDDTNVWTVGRHIRKGSILKFYFHSAVDVKSCEAHTTIVGVKYNNPIVKNMILKRTNPESGSKLILELILWC